MPADSPVALWRRHVWTTLLSVSLLLLDGCAYPAPNLEPATLTLTPLLASPASLTPSPTSAPSETATPTATVTPEMPDWRTPQAIAHRGLSALQAAAGTAKLICLRYEDTDADGTSEWVGLVQQAESDPPRLSAFVLDDETIYPLEPAFPKAGQPDIGLGQYPICGLDIRDVNGDGMPDIAVFGYADRNETLLHVFSWEGSTYRRLGFFSGDAGVRFVPVEGGTADAIWEGFRVKGAPAMAWHIIYTWRDQTYGWTSDRYDWYAATRPPAYPTHRPEYAVISYYLALNERDMPGAYGLLSPDGQRPYAEWALGYATTLKVSVGGVLPISGSVTQSSARVAAMVTAWDNEGGAIIGRLWAVEWTTVNTGEGWRLTAASAEQLDAWPVPFWP